jgi:hypothetical protein
VPDQGIDISADIKRDRPAVAVTMEKDDGPEVFFLTQKRAPMHWLVRKRSYSSFLFTGRQSNNYSKK